MRREPFYVRFGRRIRRLRVARGLSQAAIGEPLTWTRAHVSLVEHGQSRVYVHQLGPLAKALGVRIGALLP